LAHCVDELPQLGPHAQPLTIEPIDAAVDPPASLQRRRDGRRALGTEHGAGVGKGAEHVQRSQAKSNVYFDANDRIVVRE